MVTTFLPNNWAAIREHYRYHEPAILAERKDEWAIDPYAWDVGMIHFTPIESWLWADLREHNAIVYPQYPVGRVFVDFANPRAKVAIECDGAAYHRDHARDRERDAELIRRGWSVYRISGSDCRTESDEETGAPGAAGLFVRRICQSHEIVRNCTQAPRETLARASHWMEDVKALFAAEAGRRS